MLTSLSLNFVAWVDGAMHAEADPVLESSACSLLAALPHLSQLKVRRNSIVRKEDCWLHR